MALTVVEGQQGAEGVLRRQPVGQGHGVESAGADQQSFHKVSLFCPGRLRPGNAAAILTTGAALSNNQGAEPLWRLYRVAHAAEHMSCRISLNFTLRVDFRHVPDPAPPAALRQPRPRLSWPLLSRGRRDPDHPLRRAHRLYTRPGHRTLAGGWGAYRARRGGRLRSDDRDAGPQLVGRLDR